VVLAFKRAAYLLGRGIVTIDTLEEDMNSECQYFNRMSQSSSGSTRSSAKFESDDAV